jgi:FMN phosphatase YigB (HAD superfamily)
MKRVRAIICDVYRTILDVREAPVDSEERWRIIFQATFGTAPPLSLEQLTIRCRDVIFEDHSEARARGISYPEVSWPSVMKRALPAADALPHAELDSFLFRHAQLFRALRVMPGCNAVLRKCAERGILLGIASNAQAYTLRELELALSEAGLDSSIFQSDLTFWSFEHGFSKPDPHVFQMLRARLQNRNIEESETLMIGDREDNDISPARAAGWKTWQFSDIQNGSNGGDWKSLARVLFESDAMFK